LHSTSGHIEAPTGFPAYELFAAASTAVLLADADTGRVVAINPAAQSLLGVSSADVVGRDWSGAFIAPSAQELQAAALRTTTLGIAAMIDAATTGTVSAVRATLSTFRVASAFYLLVRLDAVDEIGGNHDAFSPELFEQLNSLALGFVIADEALCVEFGNRVFLDLIGEPALDAAAGQCLLRWLDVTQRDLDVMRRQMQVRQAASVLTANFITRSGPGSRVEVIAIAVPGAASAYWGFVLRPTALVPAAPAIPPRSRKDS
jgi:PAS domain-containing protein